MPTTLEEAIAQFDEKFDGVLEKKFISKDPRIPPITVFVKDDLKSFITTIWHAAEEAERTRVVDIVKKEMYEEGHEDIGSEAIANCAYENKFEAFIYGFNKALEEIITKIKEKK